jgi:putative FmdB family regulatory protein
MPEYDHECYECEYAWQDTYSVNTAPPTVCPKCGGKARRVILGCPAVKVALTGSDMKSYIKAERQKIRKQINRDENFRANITGEDSYQSTQENVKKIGEDLKQII